MGDLGQIVPMKYDPRDESSIMAVMAKANVVINLIGREYETRNYSFEEVNHHMAEQLAIIAKEHGGVVRFIQVSCLGTSPSSSSRYLKSKAAAEEAVLWELPKSPIKLVSEHVDLMAQKNIESRVEAMEELKEVKSKIQCLSRVEKSVENITQIMAKILQSMEDTQKAVAALINPKAILYRKVDEDGSKSITEGQVQRNVHRTDHRTLDRGKWLEGSENVEISMLQELDLEDPLERIFINSVQSEICREEEPTLEPGLTQIMELALKVEDKHDTLKQSQIRLGSIHCKGAVFNYNPNLNKVGPIRSKCPGPFYNSPGYNVDMTQISSIPKAKLVSNLSRNYNLSSKIQNSSKLLFGATMPMLQEKRLYHKWREKNPIGHHNKCKGLPSFEASWEPVAYHLELHNPPKFSCITAEKISGSCRDLSPPATPFGCHVGMDCGSKLSVRAT